MSEITAPLRQLTQKEVAWHWDNKHSHAVEQLKDAFTKAPILKLYDVYKQVTIAADTSNHGYGAVIMQDNAPIAYASRRLNDAEKKYAVIEKEMCAILYACRRFHDYIFGHRTVIVTDHRPLIGIFQKPLHKLSPRLQRMRMHLYRYNLEIVWKPGREMFVPDALSRNLPQTNATEYEFDDALEVNFISTTWTTSCNGKSCGLKLRQIEYCKY